jgi:hypothetical protein
MNQKMAASKLSLAVSYQGVADEIAIHVALSKWRRAHRHAFRLAHRAR